MASERQSEFTAVWNAELGLSVMRDPEKYRRLPTTHFLTVKEQMGTAKHTIPIPSVGYETLNNIRSAKKKAETEALSNVVYATPNTSPPPRKNAPKSSWEDWKASKPHRVGIGSVIKNQTNHTKGYATPKNTPNAQIEAETEAPTVIKNDMKCTRPPFVRPTTTPRKKLKYK